ncbi:class I SAM-dependent methyltransferase [Clostridium sp. CTA-7]
MLSKCDVIADIYIKPDDGVKVEDKFLDYLSNIVVSKISGYNILEMGIGTGAYTEKIIKKSGHSFVVDGSSKLIEKHREKYNNKVSLFNEYFEDFNPDIKFDAIVATNILEHLEDPVLVLKKMKSWLGDNGKIIIIVPNAKSLHRNYGVCLNIIGEITQLDESDFKVGHKRVYTSELLEEHIKLAGLTIVNKFPTYLKLLSNSQMSNFTNEQIEGLFKLADHMEEFKDYNADLFFEVTK